MKTNLKLVAGGIAGLLTAVGLMAGLLIWAGLSETPAPVAAPVSPVEPVPVPALEAELATTHRTPEPAPVVEPAPEPRSYEPTLRDGRVRLRRLIVTTSVSGHEPSGATDVIEVGAQRRVYAFVDAVNDTDEDAALEVTFEPASGESTGHVTLEIPAGAPRWRTWAWTRHIYAPGEWQVVVRAPDGRVLARRPFDVVD